MTEAFAVRTVRRRLVVCAITLLLAWPATVAAQEREPLHVWGTLGVGGGGTTVESVEGSMGLSVQLAAQRGPHQFTLRLLGLAELFGSTGTMSDVGLLYGRAASAGIAHLSASAGVSVVSHSPCDSDDPDCSSETGIGLPLAVEAAIRPLPVLGLGLQLFGDISTVGSMGGVFVMAQLGWMP